MSIRVLTTDFIRSCLPNHPTRKKDHTWKKPDPGTIKINVDASFCAEIRTGACGAVAKDYVGNFIAAATWVLSHVSSADSAEISAIHRGVLLASNIGCTNVTLESDSMNALEAMESPEVYMGPDVTTIIEVTILSLVFKDFLHTLQ
uniref:RNase H type-1 domain-containing protein n=1 Tax=Hordeum vulgare subsp. vulgare TaxID=112509 RepID=A0A8I6X1Y8_HORVV